jgi:hypothetical protein
VVAQEVVAPAMSSKAPAARVSKRAEEDFAFWQFVLEMMIGFMVLSLSQVISHL